MSLPRPVRMTHRRDFEAVRLHGSSVGSRLLALGRLDVPATAKPKAGVIVPKALGVAPVRNRLKRQLREIIREALPVLESASAHPPVFVTIARRASVHAGFDELRTEWFRLARKVGLWPASVTLPAPRHPLPRPDARTEP
jgi:ribonuclease P protein component